MVKIVKRDEISVQKAPPLFQKATHRSSHCIVGGSVNAYERRSPQDIQGILCLTDWTSLTRVCVEEWHSTPVCRNWKSWPTLAGGGCMAVRGWALIFWGDQYSTVTGRKVKFHML